MLSCAMARVLVLHASVEGQTARIAARLAESLRARGHSVVLAEVRGAADPAAYDAVVIGGSVHYGRHAARLHRFVRDHRGALETRHCAFFSVSLSGNARYAADFLRRTGWATRLAASFTGALKYSRYGWPKRRLVQLFARMGGHSTDTTRDHEYTDWDAVTRFADAFAAQLRA
jgi:menaquinone-dependent protoporphyrinogen oxidase